MRKDPEGKNKGGSVGTLEKRRFHYGTLLIIGEKDNVLFLEVIVKEKD
jgi:hypothetical protein